MTPKCNQWLDIFKINITNYPDEAAPTIIQIPQSDNRKRPKGRKN